MSGYAVHLAAVSQHFGDTTALEGVSFDLEPGGIVGLLGRNGAGKSTLLSLLASYRRPSSGQVLVKGANPFEDQMLMRDICLVREENDFLTVDRVSEALAFIAAARPNWDQGLAEELLGDFNLSGRDRLSKMSRGQRSAFGAVVGIASRAPLTLLDEVHLGMDAPTRYAFYEQLLADYAEHPRTIILSSHLIREIEQMLTDVVILDRGQVLLSEEVETLRARGFTVTGARGEVEAVASDLNVLASRHLGGTSEATVYMETGMPEQLTEAIDAGRVQLGAVSIQDLFVHLTGGQPGDRKKESVA